MTRNRPEPGKWSIALRLADIADDLTRSAEARLDAARSALFEPVIRLGVTGLARAGKTVFITSLVSNLTDRGRMPGLRAEAGGRIEAVWLRPQPDMTVPRFDYETHRAALTADDPHWPGSTRSVSELRLSFRLRPGGLRGLTGARRLHLDIVDYPGEWLLDLGLMGRSYRNWAEETLARIGAMAGDAAAGAFLTAARETDPAAPLDEPRAQALAATYTEWLAEARAAGVSRLTPGRFLLPGDLAGSPVLTFAPLPRPGAAPRGSLWREMERRYDAYRAEVVRPFFRDHFARIDRQVVLVDVLGALERGPQAFEDMRATLADLLTAFRPGRGGPLAALLGGRRVGRILFAATRADHLHHSQHPRLAALLAALLREAKDRADYAGAGTAAMAIASLRATTEAQANVGGQEMGAVRGRLTDGRQVVSHPGELPADPARLLGAARAGAADWPGGAFAAVDFAPARITLRPGEGLPHIGLDRAAEFLIGDRL